MAINLLDMVKDQMTGPIMGKVSSFLGESESNTQGAVKAAIPSLLGAFVQKGSTESGAAGLLDMIKGGNHDGSGLSNLASMLGGGDATNSLMNTGNGILSSVLGSGKLGSMMDLIGKVTGFGKRSSGSLLSLLAPIILKTIGKQVFSRGLNAGGLMNMLKGQKSFLAKAMPAGMSSLLGFSDGVKETAGRVTGAAGRVATGAADTTRETAKAGGGLLKSLLPLALLALLAGGAYYMFTGKNLASDAVSATKEGVSKVGEVAGNAADKVGEVAGDAANKVGEVAGNAWDATVAGAKKALDGVKFAAGSVGESFSNFLGEGGEGEKTFKFNELKFATSSATIDPSSMNEIDNLAKVMKAYESVQIEIQGHTDATGDAAKNKALSQARAKSVMARLAAQGVDASRMTAVGYGQTMLADPNDDAANRRVEIKVTKK